MTELDQQRAETIGQAMDMLTAAKDAGSLPGLLMVMLDGQGGYKSVWWTDEVAQTASLIGTGACGARSAASSLRRMKP
jgi:hypothetical protein